MVNHIKDEFFLGSGHNLGLFHATLIIHISFANMSYSFVSPMISIMGGLYPNDKTNPFLGVIKIFQIEVRQKLLPYSNSKFNHL